MTIAKLRSIERQLFKLVQSLRPLKNEPEVVALYAWAEKEWSRIWNLYKARSLAAAAKRDRGEVLFTVFRPAYRTSAVEENVRTPNRMLRRVAWKHYSTGELEPWKEFSGEVSCNRLYSPEYDFKRLMRMEAAA